MTPVPPWSEILYAHWKTCRKLRLEYRVGGAKENTPYQAWDMGGSISSNAAGDEEPELYVYASTVEVFRGSPDDLTRALRAVTDSASREMRVGDPEAGRVPGRVTWSLVMLDSESRTIDSRGSDWKFKPINVVHEEPEYPMEGVMVSRPREDRDVLLSFIDMQGRRIRELEEQLSSYVHLHTGALGSLTAQSCQLMESHTNNALNLSQGVITTVGEHFDLMRERLKLEIAQAMSEGEVDDFFESPMGKVVQDHLPQLLEQFPSVVEALLQWFKASAQAKAAG